MTLFRRGRRPGRARHLDDLGVPPTEHKRLLEEGISVAAHRPSLADSTDISGEPAARTR
jgi:hypothetical protein